MVRCLSLILTGFFHSETASAHQHDVAFVAFMKQQGRTYQSGSAEYTMRRQLFKQRSDDVEHWNSQPNRLWTATINHLSDWSEQEKKQLYGYVGHSASIAEPSAHQNSFLQSNRAVILAEQHVWNNVTHLDEIDDQGSCGSCWAVAAAKMLETNFAIMNGGKYRSFAAQELVDCVPNPHECGGTGGCKGATVELAMLYFSQRGLATREDTQYRGRDQKCKAKGTSTDMTVDELATPGKKSGHELVLTENRLSPSDLVPHTSGIETMVMSWERLPVNENVPLMEALTKGSVAVSADAGPWSSYGGGVFNGCPKDAVINHAILAIGYGADEKTGAKFWLIQNSWGQYWGEKGRIRLLRHDKANEHCGVDHKPSDGTGCKGGPEQVKVCGMCGVLFDNVIGYPQISK